MGHGTLRAGLSRSVICLKTCFGERNRKTKIEVSRSRKLSHLQAKLQKSKLGTALCYPPCWRGFLLFSSSLNSLSLKASFSIKSFLNSFSKFILLPVCIPGPDWFVPPLYMHFILPFMLVLCLKAGFTPFITNFLQTGVVLVIFLFSQGLTEFLSHRRDAHLGPQLVIGTIYNSLWDAG